MRKLVVCDFDGTIYIKNDERRLQRAFNAILGLPQNVVFAVASGRPLHLLKPYFDLLKDCYIISNDGALITHNGEILYENPIKKEILLNFCENEEWVAYGECISYMHYKNRSTGMKWKKMFSNHAIGVNGIMDIEENIYKIFFEKRKEEIPGLIKCYDSYGVREFTNETANKGVAVKCLSEILGIAKNDISVFGDGKNDIPMFEAAGRSYAYINSSPAVRAVADGVFSELDFKERI